MHLLTSEEMRAADHAAVEQFGIPSIVLMDNAAMAVLQATEKLLSTCCGKKIAVFCGGGNNGGDGFAVARRLFNQNASVRVFLLVAPADLQGDALINFHILQKLGVEIQQIENVKQLNLLKLALVNCDAVIDAMLGTGISGIVLPLFKSVIELINDSGIQVISVDIPSGLDADTGMLHGAGIKAKITVTFAFPKIGLIMPAASEYIGELIVADISLPKEVLQEISSKKELLDINFCRRFLPKRNKLSHKGDYGTVMLVAGSKNMPGAAYLAGMAAFLTGCGRVQACLPTACRASFTALLPEATLLAAMSDNEEIFTSAAISQIITQKADCLVLGMGLGRNSTTQQAVKELLSQIKVPCVVDADAIYALHDEQTLIKQMPVPVILTPHEGEFARICDKSVEYVSENRVPLALEFASQWQVVLVLKGSATLIATPDGRLFVNKTGNPGMATAGSGDVLSGMIGALLAQGLPAAAAAAVGVFMHGLSGDKASVKKGEYSIMARDILKYIPAVLKEIENDENHKQKTCLA